jgi:hypothetical protein
MLMSEQEKKEGRKPERKKRKKVGRKDKGYGRKEDSKEGQRIW